MSLLLEERRSPAHWKATARPDSLVNSRHVQDSRRFLHLALVNNMPDSAIEDTEAQFFALLDSASADAPVFVELYSLPGIPRSDRAREHLNAFYESTNTLCGRQLDGVIITGTEPHQPNLDEEPYWDSLAELLKWAEENTISTVLSCLAAHAGVLFSDGILRHPVDEKRFGVFEHEVAMGHFLTQGIPTPIRIPHSRWNELEERALLSAGYSVLTRSSEVGVDLFVKQKKQSLFVHFQGHPEYFKETPFKEYRRDVRRFLRKERDVYPGVPKNYFGQSSVGLLDIFREAAISHPDERLMESFPEAQLLESFRATWRDGSIGLYGNWLNYLKERKGENAPAPVFARSAHSQA